MSLPQRAPVSAIAALVAGVVQLAWTLIHTNPPVVDFPIFYATTKAMLAGARPAYPAFHPWPGGPTIYALNAPHVYLLVAPFTLLPLETARCGWRLMTLVCLAAAAMLSGVRLRSRWITAFVWCGGGTTLLLICGQVGGLLALGIAMVCVSGPVAAGALMGFLVTFKPFLGLVVLLWAWERRGRELAAAGAGAALSVFVGWLWVGAEPYVEWFTILRHHAIEINEQNASWPGFVMRVVGDSPALMLTGIAAILIVTALAVRRSSNTSHRLLIVLLASILLSPVGWAHYLWLTMVPLLVWLDAGGRFPIGAWLLWIPPQLTELSTFHMSGWLLPSCCFYGMLALWWASISGPPILALSFGANGSPCSEHRRRSDL
jgi:hypothetical protein